MSSFRPLPRRTRRPRARTVAPLSQSTLRPQPIPTTAEELKQVRTAQNQAASSRAHQTLYDLLSVEPYTSEEEIRRAYKGLLERFNPDGFIAYGLYSRTQAEALRNQFDEAYQILSDPIKRQEYNSKTFPEGLPPRKPHLIPTTFSTKLRPLIEQHVAQEYARQNVLDGPHLKKLRQKYEITLEAIHERTKISLYTLNCIEQHLFIDLPAEVYVKGFLKQLAHVLSLPQEQLVSQYLEGFHRAKK